MKFNTDVERDQHKRARFKALFSQRVNALVQRHKQMTDTQKLERLAYLANLPYTSHTSEDWDEELRLECELQDHPQYISFLNP
jgi:hypothetical protein